MINKNESFREFFIKIVYYISQLKEKHDIPYFEGCNPRELYMIAEQLGAEIFHVEVVLTAIRNNNINIVKSMVNKGYKNFDNGLEWASARGHLDIVKYFIKLGSCEYLSAARSAAERGKINIVEYFIESGYDVKLKYLLRDAAQSNHFDLVKYLVSKGADTFKDGIKYTSSIEITKYLQNFL